MKIEVFTKSLERINQNFISNVNAVNSVTLFQSIIFARRLKCLNIKTIKTNLDILIYIDLH